MGCCNQPMKDDAVRIANLSSKERQVLEYFYFATADLSEYERNTLTREAAKANLEALLTATPSLINTKLKYLEDEEKNGDLRQTEGDNP